MNNSAIEHRRFQAGSSLFSQATGAEMDPNATWQMLCEDMRALHQNPDVEEIRANVIMLLDALTRWLRQGGFPPTVG